MRLPAILLILFLAPIELSISQEARFYDLLPENTVYSFWDQGKEFYVLKKDDIIISSHVRKVKGIGNKGLQVFLNIYCLNPDPTVSYLLDEKNVGIELRKEDEGVKRASKKANQSLASVDYKYSSVGKEDFFRIINSQKKAEAILKTAVAIGGIYAGSKSNNLSSLLISSAVSNGATESLVRGGDLLNNLSTIASYDYLGKTDITNFRPAIGFTFINQFEGLGGVLLEQDSVDLKIVIESRQFVIPIGLDKRQRVQDIKVNPIK